jgi:hypothetical protein
VVGFVHFLGAVMFIYVFLAQYTVRRSLQRKSATPPYFLWELHKPRGGGGKSYLAGSLSQKSMIKNHRG